MKNNMYDFFNDVSINLDEYEREDFNDIEKMRIKGSMKKELRSQRYNYRKVIVSVGIVISLGIISLQTTLGVQAFEKVKQDIITLFHLNHDLTQYKVISQESALDDDIEVKINEVMLDGNNLFVTNQISSIGKIEDESHTQSAEIYINDNQVNYNGCSKHGENIDEFTTKNIEEYRFRSLDEIDLTGDVKIRIVYTKIVVNDNEKEGAWEFDFVINMEKLKEKTKEGQMEYKFKINNGEEITLEQYKINPINAVIYGKSISNGDRNDPYIIELRGVDDKDNNVRFKLSGGSDDLEMKATNINSDAKFIKLTPYAMKFPKKNEKPEDMVKVGEEFTINLDK